MGSDGARTGRGISRRALLKSGAAAGFAAALGGAGAGAVAAAGTAAKPGPTIQVGAPGGLPEAQLVLVNGKIHTMDPANRVVSSVAIRNGRFVGVGPGTHATGPGTKVVNLQGRTVIPGIIDQHNHIVLVGNRPGLSVLAEDIFTIPEVIARYVAAAEQIAPGEWISSIGTISARQMVEQRLPILSELDAVPRPVYIQANQGGTRTNTLGRDILMANGITNIDADGVIGGGATGSSGALTFLRSTLLNPETRRRSAHEALRYYLELGITTHGDKGAFHSELPSGGIASENTYTMHQPFLDLDAEGALPARLRIDFLHQDSASDPTLPTLSPRLRNSFPFFGNDMLATMGIGEFTGGGLNGLIAIAQAGWRGEDHSLSLNNFSSLVGLREQANAVASIVDLQWIISHVPGTTPELLDRWNQLGGGVAVGWGANRTGTNVGPAYRGIIDSGIKVGYHSDGGDITVISPWLNLYTMITGRNLSGDHILGDQNISRQEAIWLATAANKWFMKEDDLGSIEVGNHADLAVLDRDVFTCPEEEIKAIRSAATMVAGRFVHDTGVAG
jgi:hypothetical protein